MLACIDSSFFLSRYLFEPRSDEANILVAEASGIVACRLLHIEVARGLSFIEGPIERATAQMRFADDWRQLIILELDEQMADLASTIAASTGVRTLDSLHIATAILATADAFITFDRRQAAAARTFDLNVVGTS
jgi:predicted nucleic acid-binding protein